MSAVLRRVEGNFICARNHGTAARHEKCLAQAYRAIALPRPFRASSEWVRLGKIGQDWTRQGKMTRPHAPTVASRMRAHRKAVELHENLVDDEFQCMEP
jgi:hypothetical protein